VSEGQVRCAPPVRRPAAAAPRGRSRGRASWTESSGPAPGSMLASRSPLEAALAGTLAPSRLGRTLHPLLHRTRTRMMRREERGEWGVRLTCLHGERHVSAGHERQLDAVEAAVSAAGGAQGHGTQPGIRRAPILLRATNTAARRLQHSHFNMAAHITKHANDSVKPSRPPGEYDHKIARAAFNS
jgi:hypothetical protein